MFRIGLAVLVYLAIATPLLAAHLPSGRGQLNSSTGGTTAIDSDGDNTAWIDTDGNGTTETELKDENGTGDYRTRPGQAGNPNGLVIWLEVDPDGTYTLMIFNPATGTLTSQSGTTC